MRSPQVLVVGSGPAGLVLALSLLKNGVPVRIIEKDIKHHNGERGPGISPRTLEIEHFLGVVDDVRNTAGGIFMLNFHDPKDPYRIIKTSRMLEVVEPTPAFPVTDGATLGHWEHQAILRKHIEALGGSVELGTALVGFEQDEAGVTVELSKNVDGQTKTEKARFAYVAGADGAHSTVRKALSVGFVGESRQSGQIYIVDAQLEGLQGGDVFYSWGDPKKAETRIRGTNRPGVFQLFFNGDDVDFKSLKENHDAQTVQRTMNAIIGRDDIKVGEITWQGEWRPNIRMADHFRVGRVFIAGDAAHVHPPTGGQGLNSSVQDAFNLGWKLALSVNVRAAPDLLDSYEVERIPVIAEMLKISTGLFNRAYGSDTSALNRAGTLMKESEEQSDKESAWFRGRKLFQLDIHYRWSTAVFDERYDDKEAKAAADAYGVMGHDTRAGDRAPDAPDLLVLTGEKKDAKTRLFDLYNPSKHVALVFTSSASVESALALIEPLKGLDAGDFRGVLILPKGSSPSLGSDLAGIEVLLDSDGHAYTGYGIQTDSSTPAVVIVRPDGMVGAFAVTEGGTRKYIKAVFASV